MMAENIKRLKQERGLSLSQIADRAEIHRTHVSLILRGKRMVQIDTIVKLAGALEAEPADLLRGIVWVPGDRLGRYLRAWDGRFARREPPQPPCE
jgi:transcriptional regulator with XRE-family HTH domain